LGPGQRLGREQQVGPVVAPTAWAGRTLAGATGHESNPVSTIRARSVPPLPPRSPYPVSGVTFVAGVCA
jgi:hypothetical protein